VITVWEYYAEGNIQGIFVIIGWEYCAEGNIQGIFVIIGWSRVLRGIFRPERDEETGERRKIHNEELLIFTP
jgi:hypothetical protein